MASKTFKASKSGTSCRLRSDKSRAKGKTARDDAHFKSVSGSSLTQKTGDKHKSAVSGSFVSTKSESSADKLLLDAWEKTYENRHKRKG